MRRPLGGNDRGQVSVEFLGLLPLILLVLVLLWQFVLVGYTYSLAAQLRRPGRAGRHRDGRAAAPAPAAPPPRTSSPSAWRAGATISCGTEAGLWKATVRHQGPGALPRRRPPSRGRSPARPAPREGG